MDAQSGTVFLTGAGGFIGLKLVPRLLELGYRVIATDVAPPRLPLDRRAEFYAADIRDIGRHAGMIAGSCDYIVHAGGISGPMLLNDNPAEILDINIRGTTQLLALAQSIGVKRVVSLSSVSAYGDKPDLGVIDETVALSASTYYGTSKAASDLIVRCFAATAGLDVVALRLGWVYGPGRTTDALIQPMVRSAKGEPYRLEAGGDHEIQFAHVDDIVAAIVAAMRAETKLLPAYNINGREMISVRRLRDLIAEQLPGVSAEIGKGLLPGTDRQGRMSIEAARRDLGWEPAIAFADGLASYVAWLREHRY